MRNLIVMIVAIPIWATLFESKNYWCIPFVFILQIMAALDKKLF